MKNKTLTRMILLLLVVSLALAFLLSILNSTIIALAQAPDYYTVYTEDNEELCTRSEEVEVGDSYITYNNKKYEIVEVNEENKACKARYVEDVTLPNMSINNTLAGILVELEKRAGLYVTHSDESYIPNDGTESIYGRGGIYDIAEAFKTALQNEGFVVDLDETLHLPHDSAAYRKSRVTAERIMTEFKPDVLFDIHRDGAPGEAYLTTVGGTPMSKVRMVVGQSNPNFNENYQFALEIKALADEWYPGLVKDIYMGAGRYNQDLMNQALLLEFGTQEVDKNLVLKSVVPFANVINGVLQRRAISSSFFTGDINTLMVSAENDTVYNSIIFPLMVVFGIGILFLFTLFFTNKKIKVRILHLYKQTKNGLFISRK